MTSSRCGAGVLPILGRGTPGIDPDDVVLGFFDDLLFVPRTHITSNPDLPIEPETLGEVGLLRHTLAPPAFECGAPRFAEYGSPVSLLVLKHPTASGSGWIDPSGDHFGRRGARLRAAASIRRPICSVLTTRRSAGDSEALASCRMVRSMPIRLAPKLKEPASACS